MIEITVLPNDAGQRIDKFFVKTYKNLPPSLLYKGLRQKKIKCNRKRAEPGQILRQGDVLQVFLPEEFFRKEAAGTAFTRLAPELMILYEDDDVLVVDKKPGMVVHSDEKQTTGTLIDHVKAYLVRTGAYDPENENSFAPALCNRIDRNTAGIVLAAKNAESLRFFNEQIRLGGLVKIYLCAVHGVLERKTGTLRHYLVKDGENNRVRVYDLPPKGDFRTAVTSYETLAEEDGLTLLRVRLHTGRTHQIRAQFSYIGHPLLGDGKYGNFRDYDPRSERFQALCACKLTFAFQGETGRFAALYGKSFCVAQEHVRFLKYFPSYIYSPENI